jgi:hypothetical protein
MLVSHNLFTGPWRIEQVPQPSEAQNENFFTTCTGATTRYKEMPSQSDIKWSDKHQRYFRHIIADDGVILDTMWLPKDSVDATEAEDEASEQSTIPSNPAGDPRYASQPLKSCVNEDLLCTY